MSFKIYSEKKFWEIYNDDNKRRKYLKKKLIDDGPHVLDSFNRKSHLLKYASNSLKHNKKFLIDFLKVEPDAYNFIPEDLQQDKEIIIAFILNSTYESKVMWQTIDFPDNLTDDYLTGLEIIEKAPFLYKKLSKNLRDNKNIFVKAIEKGNGLIILDEDVPEEYRNNIEYIKIAIRNSFSPTSIYEKLPVEARNNRGVKLELLGKNGYNIQNFSKEDQDDEEFVLKAIENQDTCYFSSISIQDNSDLGVFESISDRLVNSVDFLADVIDKYPERLVNIIHLNNNASNDLYILYKIYYTIKTNKKFSNLYDKSKLEIANKIIVKLSEKILEQKESFTNGDTILAYNFTDLFNSNIEELMAAEMASKRIEDKILNNDIEESSEDNKTLDRHNGKCTRYRLRCVKNGVTYIFPK